jgi:hypothetical protein
MSSPELQESSARMLEVTGGRWPKNVPIPRAAGKDFFTSRMACDLKVFPYGRNIAVVVSAVMERDRQDAAHKRRAVVRIADPMREAKKVRWSAKAAASGGSKPVAAAKPAAPGHNKAAASVKAAAPGGSKPPPGGLRKGRRPLSPARRIADFGTDISVKDYFVSKLFFFDEVFNSYHGAGSGEGQLIVVPPPVVTTLPTAVVGAKGAARDPWATFCASGEILSAAAAKDVAGSMSQRLREASQQLSQQLKQVSCVGLRYLLFL